MSALDIAMNIIMKYESFRSQPYYATKDEEKRGILTIGYGATTLGGNRVKITDRITEPEAQALLKRKVNTVIPFVQKLLPGCNDNELAACVSLVYNIGEPAFANSTLVKRWQGKEDKTIISDEFPRWNKQSGKELVGLTRRRAEERELFLRE